MANRLLPALSKAIYMPKRHKRQYPLANRIESISPVKANAVFASLPRAAIDKLLKKYFFYTWDEDKNEVRWMCSWNTTEKQVDDFAQAIAQSCR